MKTPVATIVAVLVLSLALWTIFFYMGVPLNQGETAVIVGFIALVVVGGQRALAAMLRKEKK